MIDKQFLPYFYDEASGDGLVTPANVLVARVIVQEAPAGAALTFTNGSGGTVVLTIPASTAVGTIYDIFPCNCTEGLYMSSGAATAGQVTAIAKQYAV